MSSYRIQITVDGDTFNTLDDILPETNEKLKILFVAKVPTPISVEVGHYFQGRQGKMFWNKLIKYGILNVADCDKEDDYLVKHKYGIMDIVKKPRQYGDEPTDYEYLKGMDRLITVIENYKPKVVVFVYKGVLDKILKCKFNVHEKSTYGFNDNLNNIFRGSRVFVFPMPGTRCNKEKIHSSMMELKFVSL